MTGLDRDRQRALSLVPVSRETEERCAALLALLQRWQKIKNLVGPNTLDQAWTRHIADCLQLVTLAPEARRWADFGSGAGFPGLVIACALADRSGAHIHLVESNGRKVAFLREAARTLRLPVTIHDGRIETLVPVLLPLSIEVVTARALAPLVDLLHYAAPLLESGAQALFLKGQDIGLELTEAAKYWTIEASQVPSRTDSTGSVLSIRRIVPFCVAAAPVKES
jgi:16S rRNA (guanine527-N7)-methyltransferase